MGKRQPTIKVDNQEIIDISKQILDCFKEKKELEDQYAAIDQKHSQLHLNFTHLMNKEYGHIWKYFDFKTASFKTTEQVFNERTVFKNSQFAEKKVTRDDPSLINISTDEVELTPHEIEEICVKLNIN